MGDAVFDKIKSDGMSATKDFLRVQLQRSYCDSGGNQATCNANVEALVDMIYETAMYIVELQKSNPGRPVPMSLIVQFTASQMKVMGKWGGQDAVACAAAATLFGFSIVNLTPSIAIAGAIGTSGVTYTSGLGVSVGLPALAYALAGASLLIWEGYGVYESCAPIWNAPPTTATASASSSASLSTLPPGQQSKNRQQAETYLLLLQQQMSVDPRSGLMCR